MKKFANIKALLVICFFYMFSEANGQEQSKYQPAKVIPPSPTSASLGVYGELSVGYFSGTPDINIPLYEIKTSNHALPIRMQYNASGIRVNENAGWVGLGWALSAGGVIARTIRGMDDFDSQGYYFAGALPPYDAGNNYDINSTNPSGDKTYFDEIMAGRRDGEPDIFTYNFGSYSGKLVLGKQADGSLVFISEQNNLKVEYLPSTFNWKVTDPNGYTYYFGTRESTAEEYTYSSGTDIENDAPLSRFDYSPVPGYTTAWYVDSIVSPTSEAIRFFYARRGTSFGLVSKSEKEYNLLNLTTWGTDTGEPCSNPTPNFLATYRFFNASKPTTFDVYLDSIAFQNGAIKFKATDRLDTEYPSTNTGKPGKLSEIIIRDPAGMRVKKFVFQYSYFNNDATRSGRLKLDAITELGSTDLEAKPPYKFTYFNPNNLPSKLFAVNSIDHWGFYNGANNKTLLPPKTVGDGNNIQHFPGADRYSAGGETLKTGTLSSITYPTGGSTHFDYEPHDYTNLHGDDQFKIVPVTKNVYASNMYPEQNETEILDLNDTIAVTFNWWYEKYDQDAAYLMDVGTVYGDVRNMDTGQGEVDFNSCPDGSTVNCPVTSGSVTKALLPGRYTMSIRNIQGYITRASASWDNKDTITQRQGGGIRIKSIINYENGKQASIRKFYYTEDEMPGGKSAGKLISPLKYDYRISMSTSNWECNTVAPYLVRMSGSIYPMGLSSKGTVVGYDKVTEVFRENGEGGKNVYNFHNGEDYPDPDGYPSLPTYSHPLVGKMAGMATFDVAGTLLRKVDYFYRTKETAALKGGKLYYEPAFSTPTSLGDYYIKYYDSQSNWTVLSSEEERGYHGVNNAMVTIKWYSYGNNTHKEKTREKILRSDGSTIIRKFKYPGDYTTANSGSFVSQMKLRNIIAPVIEEQTLLEKGTATKLLSGSFTEYKLYNNKFYKPGLIYRLENNQPLPDTMESSISGTNQLTLHSTYRPEIYFDDYNLLGNLLQFHKANDNTYQSYLWGYRQSLPVAEIQNAQNHMAFSDSFEEESGWDGNLTVYDSNNKHAGRKAGRIDKPSQGELYSHSTKWLNVTLLSPTKFKYSGWVYSEGPSVQILLFMKRAGEAGYYSYVDDVGTSITGRWIYIEKEFLVPADVKQLSLRIDNNGGGSVWFDDLRLHPSDANMATYTYDPLVGMTSSTDANNKTTYQIFDGLQRLKLVKDDKGNIIKSYQYNYRKD